MELCHCVCFGWDRVNFFAERVVKQWDRLSREVLDSPSLDVLKKWLDWPLMWAFVLERVLITLRCFCHCWALLAQSQGVFFCSSLHQRVVWGVHDFGKEHSWPQLGYPTQYGGSLAGRLLHQSAASEKLFPFASLFSLCYFPFIKIITIHTTITILFNFSY